MVAWKQDQPDLELLFCDPEGGFFIDRLVAGVQGNKEFLAPSLDRKRDLGAVGDHDRPGREVMRADGCDHETVRLWINERASAAERISGGTGRCGHDDAIGP